MFPPFALLPSSPCFSLFCDSRFHFSALAISPFIFAYKEQSRVVKKQLKALITNTELLFSTFFVECFEVCRFEKRPKGNDEMMQMFFFKSIILKSTVYRICGFLFFGVREAVLWGSFLRLLELNMNGKSATYFLWHVQLLVSINFIGLPLFFDLFFRWLEPKFNF